MTETALGEEEDLSSRLKDSYPYHGDGTGRSEPITIRGIKIRSDSDLSDPGLTSSKDANSKRKSFFTQPQGTLEYKVMARDTLDSIALSFDSSPSQLMRLNHLSSRMIFPGQVLYVPDPDAEVPLSPVLTSPTAPEAPMAIAPLQKRDVPTVSMKPRDVPTVSQAPPAAKKGRTGTGRSFSLRRSFTRDHGSDPMKGSRPPLQKAASLPQPGHAVRQKSVEWDTDDSRQYLKVDVKYITDGEGVVSGTMLVTPNAIMFDPNVSDPLVKDRGAGPYGVMTNMDMVLGAAMYHDISAMSLKTQTSTEEAERPCCPVYVPEKGESFGKRPIPEEPMDLPDGKNGVILAQDIRQRLTGCSEEDAAAAVAEDKENHSKDATQEPSSIPPAGEETKEAETERTVREVSDNGASQDSGAKLKTESEKSDPEEVCKARGEGNAEVVESATGDGEESRSDSQKDESAEEEGQGVCPTSLGYERLQSPSEVDQGTKRFSEVIPDEELSSKAAKRADAGAAEGEESEDNNEELTQAEDVGDDVDGRRIKRVCSDDSEKSLEREDKEMEERLQEIEMLLNSSDDKMDDTPGSDSTGAPAPQGGLPASDSTGALAPLEDLPEDQSKLDSQPTAGAGEDNSSSQDCENRTNPPVEGECPGKCGSVAEEHPAVERSSSQDFVDFSSGMFVSDCRKFSLVPDLKECIHVGKAMEETLKEVKEEGQLIRHSSAEGKSSREGSQDGEGAASEAQVNGEGNNNAQAVTTDATDGRGGFGEKQTGAPVNKPPARELEYKRTNFREFLPKRAKSYEDPPLYLCLRTKKPMQKTFSAIQDHKFRKNKVPEYWFAIPRVKADNLYAFFLQWSPDVYGKEVSPSEVGFVVVQDVENVELELIEDFFKEPIHKDWEIITREEASKRRMTILECEMNLPLPELVGESTLLCNDYVRKLAKNLPPRTEGYRWVLVFNTSIHGYSLHSLYRNMAGWESPMLLILRDTEGHLFGALSSCAVKVSDHYYGTGESFLYRFKEDELDIYRWTGENNFFIKGDMDCMCIGGGEGDFGLWLDGDLYHGRSHPCKTFSNEILSAKEDFIIADMEAWGFNT